MIGVGTVFTGAGAATAVFTGCGTGAGSVAAVTGFGRAAAGTIDGVIGVGVVFTGVGAAIAVFTGCAAGGGSVAAVTGFGSAAGGTAEVVTGWGGAASAVCCPRKFAIRAALCAIFGSLPAACACAINAWAAGRSPASMRDIA